MKDFLALLQTDKMQITVLSAWRDEWRHRYQAVGRPAALCPHCEQMGLIDSITHCTICGWLYVEPDPCPIPSVPRSLKMSERDYGKRKCAVRGCPHTVLKRAPNHKLCVDHCDAKVRRGRAARMVAPHSGSRKVKR